MSSFQNNDSIYVRTRLNSNWSGLEGRVRLTGVYGCCLDECGCSSCQTELVAEQGLQCGCHDGQMGHIELVPDASLGAMERPGNAIRAPFLRPGPCSVHLYPPRRTSSCHCAARVRCHLPGALACGPDSSLRVQRDLSDEAALSSAALPFALPCRAGAVVDFRASSILSGLWAGDLSPLFLFLECSAHFIPGKPLSFLSFGAASPGIFPLSSVPSRLL